MGSKILAIIPARSGSKGLPDKNIKLLAGKPLMAYTIEAAIKSGEFDNVMVSTDSQKYADIAVKCGAEVPFLRSVETSSDKATTREAVLEILDKYSKNEKIFDKICILQPTSPLRTADDIKGAVNFYNRVKAKSVVSVCEMDHSPLWANTLPEDRCMDGFLNNSISKPRQDLETYYRINGAIYLCDTAFYIKNENLYQKDCYAYIMDRRHSIDIDEQLDFDFAENMVKKMEF